MCSVETIVQIVTFSQTGYTQNDTLLQCWAVEVNCSSQSATQSQRFNNQTTHNHSYPDNHSAFHIWYSTQ